MVNKIYEIIYKIYYLMKLNFLWILFTLIGGVVFGIVPSTMALFACIRNKLKNDDDSQLYPQYKKFFTDNFRRSIKMSIVFIGILVILLYETTVLRSVDSNIIMELTVKLSRILIVMDAIMFFPLYSHFDLHGMKLILQPTLFIFLCPIETVLFFVIAVVTGFIYFINPLLIIFIGVSLPAYGVMSIMMHRFKKLEEKIPYMRETEN